MKYVPWSLKLKPYSPSDCLYIQFPVAVYWSRQNPLTCFTLHICKLEPSLPLTLLWWLNKQGHARLCHPFKTPPWFFPKPSPRHWLFNSLQQHWHQEQMYHITRSDTAQHQEHPFTRWLWPTSPKASSASCFLEPPVPETQPLSFVLAYTCITMFVVCLSLAPQTLRIPPYQWPFPFIIYCFLACYTISRPHQWWFYIFFHVIDKDIKCKNTGGTLLQTQLADDLQLHLETCQGARF